MSRTFKLVGGPADGHQIQEMFQDFAPKELRTNHDALQADGNRILFSAYYELIAGCYYFMSDDPRNETAKDILSRKI